MPPAFAGGRRLDYLVLDLDATLIEVHSDQKDQAAAHFKDGFGFHPLLCFLDNTNEALAGILRAGNVGSNTAADHLTVLDQALAQLPDNARAERILVRTDGAGFSHAFIEHLTAAGLEYSLGYAVTEVVREAISLLPEWAWTIAGNHDGQRREGAQAADLTLVLAEATRLRRARQARERAAGGKPPTTSKPATWPDGMRIIVRR